MVEKGINIETVNIHMLGDVILSGYGTLATIKVNCMLPANSYPFASDSSPEPYINQFNRWVSQGRKLRFIVGGTGVNIPVKLQSFQHGENDGTNDVYATITMREYRDVEATETAATSSIANPRAKSDQVEKPGVQNYIAIYGDTLSSICRKYYGDGSAATYNRLAAYNGKANPNLLMTGETLKIPQPLP